MDRRNVLSGLLVGVALAACKSKEATVTERPSAEEARRRIRESREKALKAFPFERVQVAGAQALDAWSKLKSAGRGVPVIVGDDESLAVLADPFGQPDRQRPIAQILSAAAEIQHPRDLLAKRGSDTSHSIEYLKTMLEQRPDMQLPATTVIGPDGRPRELTRDEVLARMLEAPSEPEEGDWPDQAMESPGLSVALDMRAGQPLASVTIILVPTGDWTTVPAHLQWGGWNECPEAEYHVAAFRSWRDRYGAELIGLTSDTLNLRVTSGPKTRTEALALAREQYVYCADIIDQGAETFSNLAATLMADPWWFFWWD